MTKISLNRKEIETEESLRIQECKNIKMCKNKDTYNNLYYHE